ncbi:MAG: outer membrane beta-barrel protein [Bacteroidota bacterium]
MDFSRVLKVTFFLLVFSTTLYAQKLPPKFSFGIEFRSLQNLGLSAPENLFLLDSAGQVRATVDYEFTSGIGFGGIIRVRLTDFWNIETGISYARQTYTMDFIDLPTGRSDQSELDVVTYELPAKGLVYIQLGEKLFANVALGVSLNFIASNVEVFGLDGEYSFGALQERVFNGAVLGGLGVEYRTEEDGYFYLGGSFHQPFADLMVAQVNYFVDRDPPPLTDRGAIAGAYFGIDFRYFFPIQESREKTKTFK